MLPGSYWELKFDVNGYKNLDNSELSTQARTGRKFEVLCQGISSKTLGKRKRLKVRLLEDGYTCWLDLESLKNNAFLTESFSPQLLSKEQIQKRIPKILTWVKNASMIKNSYLWGGTIGPNFDCSGLIQTSFASQQIWLPRDAYQQENFCRSITFNENTFQEVNPGDLIFFGSTEKCTHVGIYQGKNLYWHSSGKINGHNGISIDELQPRNKNNISSFYRSQLRSIGRVECCHDGSTLP